jgi:uncharacterized damage-inducible protein DinB
LNPQTDAAIAQALLQEFEHELATTRKFLERVPQDKLTWRPHEKSMTAGQLALHIAQTPAGVLEMARADQGTPPDMNYRPTPQSLQDVLEALDRSADYVRKTLPTLDDYRMQQTFTVSKDGKTLLAFPRAGFLRMIMLNHWYHHRGQLGVYLRMLGAKVPSSYGPSGDESPFGATT